MFRLIAAQARKPNLAPGGVFAVSPSADRFRTRMERFPLFFFDDLVG
jgi:hypothetical protein